MNIDLDINTIFSAYDEIFCARNQRIKSPIDECGYDPEIINKSIDIELMDEAGWKIINDFNPDLIGWIGPDSLIVESDQWDRVKLYSKSKPSKRLNTPTVSIDKFTIDNHYGLIISYYEVQIILVKNIDSDLISFLSYDGFNKGSDSVSNCLNEFNKYIIRDYFKIKFKNESKS